MDITQNIGFVNDIVPMDEPSFNDCDPDISLVYEEVTVTEEPEDDNDENIENNCSQDVEPTEKSSIPILMEANVEYFTDLNQRILETEEKSIGEMCSASEAVTSLQDHIHNCSQKDENSDIVLDSVACGKSDEITEHSSSQIPESLVLNGNGGSKQEGSVFKNSTEKSQVGSHLKVNTSHFKSDATTLKTSNTCAGISQDETTLSQTNKNSNEVNHSLSEPLLSTSLFSYGGMCLKAETSLYTLFQSGLLKTKKGGHKEQQNKLGAGLLSAGNSNVKPSLKKLSVSNKISPVLNGTKRLDVSTTSHSQIQSNANTLKKQESEHGSTSLPLRAPSVKTQHIIDCDKPPGMKPCLSKNSVTLPEETLLALDSDEYIAETSLNSILQFNNSFDKKINSKNHREVSSMNKHSLAMSDKTSLDVGTIRFVKETPFQSDDTSLTKKNSLRQVASLNQRLLTISNEMSPALDSGENSLACDGFKFIKEIPSVNLIFQSDGTSVQRNKSVNSFGQVGSLDSLSGETFYSAEFVEEAPFANLIFQRDETLMENQKVGTGIAPVNKNSLVFSGETAGQYFDGVPSGNCPPNDTSLIISKRENNHEQALSVENSHELDEWFGLEPFLKKCPPPKSEITDFRDIKVKPFLNKNSTSKRLEIKPLSNRLFQSFGTSLYARYKREKRLKKMVNITEYLLPDSNEKLFVCDECGNSYKNKIQLNRHILNHANKNAFPCDICGKVLARKCSLQSHLSTHSDEKPYICEICGKCFNQKTYLKTHIQIHSNEYPYECEQCGKRFKQRSYLRTHVGTHISEKSYSCDYCDKWFLCPQYLKKHLAVHIDEKLYSCEMCDMRFKRKFYLARHLSTHSDAKPYKCDYCNKCFKVKTYFKKHVALHKESKPFMCNVCSKTFSVKVALTKHALSHYGVQPYKSKFKCEDCGRIFARKALVEKHQQAKCEKLKHPVDTRFVRLGTGPTPWACTHCDKAYTAKRPLKKHFIAHHVFEK